MLKQGTFLLILGLGILVTSCGGVQKMNRSGLSFRKANKHNKDKEEPIAFEKINKQLWQAKSTYAISIAEPVKAEPKVAELPSEKSFTNSVKTTFNDTLCDEVIFKNGNVLSVRIVEVLQNEVRYSSCRSNIGPDILISKSEIFMIEYADGFKEFFIPNEAEKQIEELKLQNFETGILLEEREAIDHSMPGLIAGTTGGFISGLSTVALFIIENSAIYMFGLAALPVSVFGLLLNLVALRKTNRLRHNFNGPRTINKLGLIFSSIGIIVSTIGLVFFA